EVLDLHRRLLPHLLGHDATMAVTWVGFVAEQAGAFAAFDHLHQGGELILSFLGLEVLQVDAAHFLMAAGSRGGAPVCWRAQAAKLEIVDPGFSKACRQRILRESGSAGARDRPDVDEDLYAGALQRLDEVANGGALVADGRQGSFHGARPFPRLRRVVRLRSLKHDWAAQVAAAQG